jgi:hypothetical protein
MSALELRVQNVSFVCWVDLQVKGAGQERDGGVWGWWCVCVGGGGGGGRNEDHEGEREGREHATLSVILGQI